MNNNLDNIESNWETYTGLCNKAVKHGMGDLLDTLGERLIMCPASSRVNQYGCHPAGLIKHSLDVAVTMRTLNESLGYDLSITSVLKVGLLHDIGKVGDLEDEYFLEQDSNWHREKLGQHYKYNEDLNKMSVSHRTLYLLQHFGITLNNDEWLAIQLAQGSHFEENRFYVGHEPTLAMLLQHSKQVVIHRAVKSTKG